MVDVPAAPPMGRVPNVELVHTGTWPASTGPATFIVEDLTAAVAALDCPSVRRPILKLGHTRDPAPGQPAVGFIANMAVADDGKALVGDYVGMPGWLVDTDDDGNSVLTSAYPDRSIEGAWNFQCQIGHTHPFVITAVALLGEELPAIGTIESLQDLGALYGVAAAAEPPPDSVTVTIRSTQGDVMPNPRPVQVAASVTTEDVRRAFYASPVGAGWSKWIEEMQLDPLQLIVVDDEAGTRARLPVAVGEGDGQEAVSFGEAVDVVIRYDDATNTNASAADTGGRRILFASRTESRPAPTPAGAKLDLVGVASKKQTSPAVSAGAASTSKEGAGMDPAKLREGLGLDPDASDDEVKAKLAEHGLATAGEPAPTSEGDGEGDAAPVAASAPKKIGTMTIDASAWDEQQKRLRRLEADATKRAREERDQVIAQAIQDGKFLPTRRDHWVRLWDADPEGTRDVLAGLTKNVIPVEAMGHAGGDDSDAAIDDEFAHLWPPVHEKKGA